MDSTGKKVDGRILVKNNQKSKNSCVDNILI